MSRNQAVDFFRGLGLWMLFVNHLTPNVWSQLTTAQFGFSDFAEILVFLSGYVNASMYNSRRDSIYNRNNRENDQRRSGVHCSSSHSSARNGHDRSLGTRGAFPWPFARPTPC